jgi:hypothetical protein
MKKNKQFISLIVFMFFLQGNFLYSQGINNIFMYGYFDGGRGYMKVDSISQTIYYDTLRTINMRNTTTNISDTLGNLLFYTNGVNVCDALNDTMPNGKGLNPCQYTTDFTHFGLALPQADLILPNPGNSSEYYLIHQSLNQYPTDYTNTKLYYSKINMFLNGGKGDLFQKNISFFQDTLWGASMTACKHANGRDWWIVALRAHTPVYFVFLLTPTGISYQSSQTIGSRWDCGQVAFSPNGEFFGIREFAKNFQIFDFDRCTGLFSNSRYVSINDSMYGLGFCFSPDSKIAYATSAHYIYQVNLDSVDLSSSLDTVAHWDSTYNPFPPIETGFDVLQLATNGKIYVATTGTTQYMHIINYPDSSGIACDIIQHGLYFGDSVYNWNSVPNHPNYFLGPVVGSVCDSLTGMHEHLDEIINFQIKPNPAREVFSISYLLPQNKSGMFEMYDMVGKKIYSMALPIWSTLQRIETSEMASGVYIGVITSNKRKIEKKIVVIKE